MAHSTRDKILIAAATMLGEDPTARLSVRAVAARAGVSTGSLRHFFPTQRELVDTVVAGIHDIDLPEDPMRDSAGTPAERLVACLRLMVSQVGTGDRARAHWRAQHDAYIAAPPSEDAVHAYLALERLGVHRLVTWLTVLREEGALAPGDLERHARFLLTVLSGLLTERALPGDRARLEFEAGTLATAAAAVLRPAAPA
ncbi:TetR/AcrR family transcriptional regulator [Pseudonocardia spirodelae]|uniref:TetR/AcrR family transcriptional regulator n=1 Tax=Pseudonocardia spirodelae TaxID=3133431 RepID=A0ABU8T2L2_9PSEU